MPMDIISKNSVVRAFRKRGKEEEKKARRKEGRKGKDKVEKKGDTSNIMVISQFQVLSPRERNLPNNHLSLGRVLV